MGALRSAARARLKFLKVSKNFVKDFVKDSKIIMQSNNNLNFFKKILEKKVNLFFLQESENRYWKSYWSLN